jgi:hypothetical protein
MTPKQREQSTTIELVQIYKNKARCFHSEGKAESIYLEIHKRIGGDMSQGIRLGAWHLQHGEGDAEFNMECDKLIKELTATNATNNPATT